MLEDVLAIPEHLRDALWRLDSARLEPADGVGLLICGMGGSAIGGELAAAALGSRLRRPLLTVRGYQLPSWATPEWVVLCSSYSGETEETLGCFEAAGALGARRIVLSTGGALVGAARDAGVPVIGLPAIFQPRAAVAYMFTVAAEVAVLIGAAPSLRAEIEAAADFLAGQADQMQAAAAQIAAGLKGLIPVIYGAELTAPIARRWKAQINENAKLAAFFSELPEADHNELCGWEGAAESSAALAAVFLNDADQHPRVRRRFELTAEAIASRGAPVASVPSRGDARVARLFWTTMLGDLVSLGLAEARGIDPLPVEAIERLKVALGQPG